jgi:hypothetical protein
MFFVEERLYIREYYAEPLYASENNNLIYIIVLFIDYCIKCHCVRIKYNNPHITKCICNAEFFSNYMIYFRFE